jgi:hypothetical protein
MSSSQSAGYNGARYAWAVSNTGSGDVGGAGQGTYLEVAITDLQLALNWNLPGGRRAYHAAIREMRQMVFLPDTDVTPHQQAEYKADVVRLNHFFGTTVPV